MFINRIREIKYGLAAYVIVVKLIWEYLNSYFQHVIGLLH
jgi:hypothetical protein